MRAGELMSRCVVSIEQREPVSAAARLMKSRNLGSLPVCDGTGRLRGIVTDRDIVTRCVAADMDPGDTMVREIMSRGLSCCDIEDDAAVAAAAMGQKQLRRLPVLQEGKLVGMLSLADLAKSGRMEPESAAALSDISANIRRESAPKPGECV